MASARAFCVCAAGRVLRLVVVLFCVPVFVFALVLVLVPVLAAGFVTVSLLWLVFARFLKTTTWGQH
jgi:hypothetical protein